MLIVRSPCDAGFAFCETDLDPHCFYVGWGSLKARRIRARVLSKRRSAFHSRFAVACAGESLCASRNSIRSGRDSELRVLVLDEAGRDL